MVVVGLYFLFLWVDGQTRRGAIVAFFVDVGLLGLDGGLWGGLMHCFFIFFIARGSMVAGRGEENESGGLWGLGRWGGVSGLVLTYYVLNR